MGFNNHRYMLETEIIDVPATAKWMAACRAIESNSLAPLFRDEFAGALAGDQGVRIVSCLPGGRANVGLFSVRTKIFDDLVSDLAFSGKIDAVLNLGAGLDARPFRLQLPTDFQWVDADFPELVQYKAQILDRHLASCRFEQVALDLNNSVELDLLFHRLNQNAKKVLVLTEGVLAYLSQEKIDALNRSILAQPNFRFWLQDYYSPEVAQMVKRRWGRQLQSAPFLFVPQDWIGFFKNRCWRVEKVFYTADEAHRLGREPKLFKLLRWFGKFWRARYDRYRQMSGYVLFIRSEDKSNI